MSTDIKKLYGVGTVRAAAYARLGIETVEDLLAHYPRGYEDRGDVRLLSEFEEGKKTSHILVIGTEPKSTRIRGRLSLLKFRAYDESGICEITFFNQEFLRNTFVIGESFRFYGKVETKGGRYSMTSPAYEPIHEGKELPPLLPVYPLTEGLSQKQLAKDMKSAMVLAACWEEEDPLPEEIRRKHRLCPLAYARRNIHLPESFQALATAKKRLIFDEFFTFSLGLSLVGSKTTRAAAPACRRGDIAPLLDQLPYALTGAQQRVIEDIRRDMAKPIAMNRLVVGDVGSGKTVCAAAAILIAVQNGYQAALMAPTEILARQHYADLSALFKPLGISCELLVGALSSAEKKRIHSGLCAEDPTNRIQVVIGTQALLSEGVTFSSPGLMVADEQHRFGVHQRATLAEKNHLSHTLVMSATPIPRSLALSLYGNLEVSNIDEMPPGRQKVDTFVVNEDYRQRLNGFILKQVSEGGQVYVVCPSVETTEEEEADLTLDEIDGEGRLCRKLPLKSAVSYAEQLQTQFPSLSISFLHGKLKPKEKDVIMQRFVSGETDVLVSTTVIEVGVNVPNACLMIVENAERFGLSQLHQLRGRVGRGKRKSYCVLVSEATGDSEKSHDRLQIMRSCYDGYTIAEKDLQMRGPGDFLRNGSGGALRQSGGVRFRLAELCDDSELFQIASEEAKSLITADPSLSASPGLMAQVCQMFSLEEGTLN
ncbi:MAG: ATP-dependent DNA helicase RecG [Clostridia bacterium]|nr:ATP-dependent DNA helicase RecG [Clostridia bacterium]